MCLKYTPGSWTSGICNNNVRSCSSPYTWRRYVNATWNGFLEASLFVINRIYATNFHATNSNIIEKKDWFKDGLEKFLSKWDRSVRKLNWIRRKKKRNQNFIYANKITQVIIVLDERCSISWIFLCTNCVWMKLMPRSKRELNEPSYTLNTIVTLFGYHGEPNTTWFVI